MVQPFSGRLCRQPSFVHTARARLRLPDEAGRYRLAFRLGNTLGQTARLANCLEIENGYHILWTFTI